MSKEYPWGKGTIKTTRDAAPNDSDKIVLTVPAKKIIDILWVDVNYVATATAGNRVLVFIVTDGTNTVFNGPRTANITASFNVDYTWAPGGSAAVGGVAYSVLSTPRLILPAGYTVRVYDGNAVDPAADDMTVVLHYVEYDA